MKPLLILLLISANAAFAHQSKTFDVKSPDGKIELNLATGPKLMWSVKHEGTQVIAPSAISITLEDGEVLGNAAKVTGSKTASVNASFSTPFYKKKTVADVY